MKYIGKDIDPTTRMEFINKDIIVDSGTSFNMIPQTDLDIFLASLKKLTDLDFEIDVIP